MAVHAYHEQLPGYHPDQIWHDGCGECEERGATVYRGIGHLDQDNFARAWQRAIDWNIGDRIDLHIAEAERVLLETLWAVRCQLETQQHMRVVAGPGPLRDVLAGYFGLGGGE